MKVRAHPTDVKVSVKSTLIEYDISIDEVEEYSVLQLWCRALFS